MTLLQSALRAALPAGSIISPAAVMGEAPTLSAAVMASPGGARSSLCGWPSEAETRGGILLLLDVWSENREAGAALRAIPQADRLFFLRSSAADGGTEHDAVYVESGISCPPGDAEGGPAHLDAEQARLRSLTASGAMVRASLDGGACWARHGVSKDAYAAAVAATGVQQLATNDVDAAGRLLAAQQAAMQLQ